MFFDIKIAIKKNTYVSYNQFQDIFCHDLKTITLQNVTLFFLSNDNNITIMGGKFITGDRPDCHPI